VAVPVYANTIYNGTKSAPKAELLVAYTVVGAYVGSNTSRWDIEELATPQESGAAVAGFGVSLTMALLAALPSAWYCLAGW